MEVTMKKLFLVLAIGSAFVLSGCAPTTPQVDLEAEMAAIENTINDWLEATNQEGEAGADGWVSFITEDAAVLPPNGERVDGRAPAREVILQFTQAEDFSIEWRATNTSIAADGKLAYVIGAFELSLKDADGNPVSDKGKFLDILRKQVDGSWKAEVVMWSSDQPAGGAAE